MTSFLAIFVLILLLVAAAVCAVLLLRSLGSLQLSQGSWPYAQRRFASRTHRGLLRELGEAGRE